MSEEAAYKVIIKDERPRVVVNAESRVVVTGPGPQGPAGPPGEGDFEPPVDLIVLFENSLL